MNVLQVEICIIGICRNVINSTLIVGEELENIQKQVREISIDGKAIRSTNNFGNQEKALQIVTAYDVNAKMPVKSENTPKILNMMKKVSIKLHSDYIKKNNPKRKAIISSIRNCLTNDKRLEHFLDTAFYETM